LAIRLVASLLLLATSAAGLGLGAVVPVSYFRFANSPRFFECECEVFSRLRIFVTETMDYTAGAVEFETLGLGCYKFIQDLAGS
jgi:hypothetical protein